MHVHLVDTTLLVLEGDQQMVQRDFKRLEKTPGEEFLLAVDADFIQYLFFRHFPRLMEILVEDAFRKAS